MRNAVILLVLAMACGGRPVPARDPHGALGGIVIDAGSGDPVAMAQIVVRSAGGRDIASLTSNKHGIYDLEKLAPGTYEIDAVFAGQPLRVRNVVITAGRMAYVDLVFTLGSVEPLDVDYGDPAQGAITHFRPSTLAPNAVRIEGTVSAFGTRERIPGAVVTAISTSTPHGDALQTVSDERGAYHFADIPPGIYTVSAYYTMGGRGQIEVQRNSISIGAGRRRARAARDRALAVAQSNQKRTPTLPSTPGPRRS